MAQWALNVRLSGVDLTQPRVAPAGTGAFFMVRRSTADDEAFIAKISAAGAATWKRLITQSGGNITRHHACAIGSDMAIATESPNGVNVARINDADGTIAWQVLLDDVASGWVPDLITVGTPFAADATGNLYLAVRNSGDSVRYVVKFDGTDGSVLWVTQVGNTSFACEVRDIKCMSDDSPVLSWTNSSDSGVMVLDPATGAMTWTRKLVVTGATTTYWRIAVDPSDNVYHLASQDGSGNFYKLCITKFDSSGGTTWDQTLTEGDSHYNRAASLVADGSYVYAGAWAQENSNAYKQHSIARLNAAGSAAVSCTFEHPRSPLFTNDGLESQALVSGGHYGTGFDENTGSPNRDEAVIFRNEAFDAQSLSGYARTALDYTVGAGSATISTISPSVTTSVSSTTNTGELSSAADTTYELTLFSAPDPTDETRFATSLGPSTTFGTPRNSWSWPAPSIGPTATFGTPAYDPNVELPATSLGPTATAGTPYAFIFFGDTPPHYVASISGTMLGTPTAIADGAFTQEPTPVSTVLGTPIVTMAQPTTSIGPVAALGTPAVSQQFPGFGIASTALGEPMLTLQLPAEAISSTMLGTPRVLLPALGLPVASIGPTATLGTPAVVQQHVPRPIYPGTRLGVPTAVQACA